MKSYVLCSDALKNTDLTIVVSHATWRHETLKETFEEVLLRSGKVVVVTILVRSL